jgi:hypothetical protein
LFPYSSRPPPSVAPVLYFFSFLAFSPFITIYFSIPLLLERLSQTIFPPAFENQSVGLSFEDASASRVITRPPCIL